MTRLRRRDQRGAAVVDFVLVLIVLVPLFLGILQLALVMHVRNVLTTAASEGARVAATLERGPGDGEAAAAAMVRGSLADRYASAIVATTTSIDGQPAAVVTIRARVPALGFGGPGIDLQVSGRAVEETPVGVAP